MRELSEIQKDISNVTLEILSKKKALSDLRNELIEAHQKSFEEKLGVKKGDMITDENGKKYFYSHCDGQYGMLTIVCNPIKKDGTPSKSESKLTLSEFGMKNIFV